MAPSCTALSASLAEASARLPASAMALIDAPDIPLLLPGGALLEGPRSRRAARAALNCLRSLPKYASIASSLAASARPAARA